MDNDSGEAGDHDKRVGMKVYPGRLACGREGEEIRGRSNKNEKESKKRSGSTVKVRKAR